MDNKRYLDTLIACGKIEIDNRVYERLCSSLIDISLLLKAFIKYKRDDNLCYGVNILNLICKYIDVEYDLKYAYNMIVNILSIGLKYGVTNKNGLSIDCNLYESLKSKDYIENNITIGNVVDKLKKFSVIYLGNGDSCKIEIDNIRYKVESSNFYGLVLKDAKGNKRDLGNKVALIRLSLNKIDVIEMNNEVEFVKEVAKTLKEDKEYVYIVKSIW